MKKILIVDNQPLLLKFLSDFLQKEGYEVRMAEDGLRALDVLEEYEPQIMFIDMVMPNIDGATLCRIARKIPKLKESYIIILSAIAAEQPVDFRQFGANAIIAKGPFNSMSRHVLDILTQIEEGKLTDDGSKIIGLDEVHSREITRELLTLKHHFEVVLESMAEGIMEITSDFRIVYANRVAVNMSGLPEERLLSSSILDLFEEEQRDRVRNILESRSLLQSTIPDSELFVLNERQIEVRVTSIEEGQQTAIVVLVDVTEKKRFELQLEEARKLESIGTLAAGVAHDFNNLLMGIQGNASMILLDLNPTHPHHGRLITIQHQIERAKHLISQLLGYARKGKYQVTYFQLNDLIRESAETFGRTRKEMQTRLEPDPGLHKIEADLGQIEQVLLNLFVNAADAMPGGGDLLVRTQNVQAKEIVSKLYNPKPGAYIMIEITDHGIGMDKETQKRIFDPFFSTKEMGRGTGLGLASVYGTVKGHGGYIEVESKRNKGTTFRIYFPVTHPRRTETPEPPPPQCAKPSTAPANTILLVDDEEIIRTVGRNLLEAIGYRVLSASGGAEALEIYKKNRESIILVVLDVVMPRMSGGAVYDRLKTLDPEIRVLLASGYSIEGEVSDILSRGAKGFIQKPFTLDSLRRSIDSILEKQPGL
ncbi:MAG TPA: response regulator [Spirochaetia bacterium]|nr:response regulator [Spirochaetia bacterium]